MLKLQWRPCHFEATSSHFTLPFSLQTPGNLYRPDTFSDDTSLKSFLLHQYQTLALHFCMTFLQRQRFYYLSLTQLGSFIPVHCTYADIFRYIPLFPPCTGNLWKQQVNEFWKTPSWQFTSYSRKTFITIISIIKYYAANAVQNGLFVGRLVEAPVPGGTFPRSCLGLWSDPSSTFLVEKK